MVSTKRRRVTVAAGVVVLLVGAGVAYAAWTASGTGGGAASSTTAKSLVVTAGTGAGDLYPSASSNTGVLSLSIQNPNPYPVVVTSLGADSNGVPSNPSCNVTAVHAAETVSITVAAGATVNWTSPTPDVNLPFAASDNCQGTTFTFAGITATGAQTTTP
jgi:hypothetical protein